MKVTIFKNISDTSGPNHIMISQALNRIRDGRSKDAITAVREGTGNKKDLPVVCFSGEFAKREDGQLLEHSGFIVLDFDKLGKNVYDWKEILCADPFTYACWISPSGNGIKSLIRVTNTERHRDHFRGAVAYFKKQYDLEVDPTGINESRACFESYDPEIFVNEECDRFGSLLSEKGLEQPEVVNKEVRTDYRKLNVAAEMIRKAPDGKKHETLVKAARLCGGFIANGRMEESEVYRVLQQEISYRDVDDLELAKKTITDAIENGKLSPIQDVINQERDAMRELRINDGDMSFISSDDDDFKWVEDFANGEISVGLTTGNSTMDQYFRYKKELLFNNGHSNVGKTTVSLYLMINASVRHGWKWVVYSSENRTAALKMKIMEMAADKKVGQMSSLERKDAFKWVNEHFTVVKNEATYSYYDLIIFCEKMIKQQEVDGFLIDPYNSLRIKMDGNSGLSTHEYHYEATSELLTFSNTNNVAVWVNAHAVTEAQRRKDSDGLPVAPYAEDTEGGGKYVNRSDCFMTSHRKVQSKDPYDRATTELHIRKVRETETGGMPTPLDEPIKLRMNNNRTAFELGYNKKRLFEPLVFGEESRQTGRIFANKDFLNT